MENLYSHIIFLLSRRDCVIVPGVGAFIAERRPASYNDATGRWVPPTRHIAFNAAVRSDDGLLAHSYSRALGVDFEHGRKEMELAIGMMLDTLRACGCYALGTLGTLHLAEEGRLTFTPASRPGTRAARIGLHAFSILPISALSQAPSSRPALTSGEETLSSTEVSAPEVAELQKALTRTRRNGFRRLWSRIAVACSVVAVAVVGALMLARVPGPSAQMASVVPVPAARVAQPEARKAKAPQNVPNVALPVVEEPKETPAPMAEADSAHEGRFHLIVATFTTPEEADKYIRQSASLPAGDQMYAVKGARVTRVAVAASDSRSELLAALNVPAFRQAHPTAWIWESNR